MSNDKIDSNGVLLIVDAINRQTDVLQKRLDNIESVGNETNEIVKNINCDRCVNSSIEYNGMSIKFKTILTTILLFEILILMSTEGIDVSFVQGILLSLL